MEQRNVDFPPVNAERIGRKLTREWRERERSEKESPPHNRTVGHRLN
jgi:hypothetical protein